MNPSEPSCLYPSFKNTLYTIDNPTRTMNTNNNLREMSTIKEYSSFKFGTGVTSVKNDTNFFKNVSNDGNTDLRSNTKINTIITIRRPKYFLSSTEENIK